MSKRVAKSDFKARALALLREVEESGTSLVVTDRGKPVIEVRPFRQQERAGRNRLKGSLLRFDRPTDPVGLEDWETLSGDR